MLQAAVLSWLVVRIIYSRFCSWCIWCLLVSESTPSSSFFSSSSLSSVQQKTFELRLLRSSESVLQSALNFHNSIFEGLIHDHVRIIRTKVMASTREYQK